MVEPNVVITKMPLHNIESYNIVKIKVNRLYFSSEKHCLNVTVLVSLELVFFKYLKI